MGSPHHIFVPALTSELNYCELAARLYIQTPYTPMYGMLMMHPLLHSVLECLDAVLVGPLRIVFHFRV